MWLHKLKIAVVEQDIERLNLLMDDLPHLETDEEIESALCLLREATHLVENLRDQTQTSMKQMQKNIDFLKSTQAPLTSKLDINS